MQKKKNISLQRMQAIAQPVPWFDLRKKRKQHALPLFSDRSLLLCKTQMCGCLSIRIRIYQVAYDTYDM